MAQIYIPAAELSENDKKMLNSILKDLKSENLEKINQCCDVIYNCILEDFPVLIIYHNTEILKELTAVTEIYLDENNVPLIVKCFRKILEKSFLDIINSENKNMISATKSTMVNVTDEINGLCWSSLTIATNMLRKFNCPFVINETLNIINVSFSILLKYFTGDNNEHLLKISLFLVELTKLNNEILHLLALNLICILVTKNKNVLNLCSGLENILKEAVLNPGIWCLNNNLKNKIILILDSILNTSDNIFSKILSGVMNMCNSLVVANKLINDLNNVPCDVNLEQAIISLDFSPDILVIRTILESLCRVNEINSPNILLSLLSHNNENVQLESYSYCLNIVTNSLKFNEKQSAVFYEPENINFLCDDNIIREILTFGITTGNKKKCVIAENIIICMIKSKSRVSSTLWSKISSVFGFLLPLLVSAVNKNKNIERVVHQYVDPSYNSNFSQCFKGTLLLLFSTKDSVRQNALGCLRHLISIPNSIALNSDIFILKCPTTYNLTASHELCSEASVKDVITILRLSLTDIRLQNSALRQLITMLDYSNFLNDFIQTGGFDLCISLLKLTLEHNQMELLLSIIRILNFICGKSSTARQTIAVDDNLLMNIIKAIFRNNSIYDEDFKIQFTYFIFLILCSDFIKNDLNNGIHYLHYFIHDNLLLPIDAKFYSKNSPNTPKDHWQSLCSITEGKFRNNMSLLLNCQLAVIAIGGAQNFYRVETTAYLNPEDVKNVSLYDPYTFVLKHFKKLQVCENILEIIDILALLDSYLLFYTNDIKLLPWSETFTKFLIKTPESEEEYMLLLRIIKFISNQKCTSWIPWKNIICKFDTKQVATAQPYFTLITSASSYCELKLEILLLFNDYISALTVDANSYNTILRLLIKCLSVLNKVNNEKIGSRPLAGILRSLIQLICSIGKNNTFKNYQLLEDSFLCIISLYDTDKNLFMHHFCAVSEDLNIFYTMLDIISRNDMLYTKGHIFTLLSMLSSSKAVKTNAECFTLFIKKAIRISLDADEIIFVRNQAVTFLSSMIICLNVPKYVRLIKTILTENSWFLTVSELKPIVHEKSDMARYFITPKCLAAMYHFIYLLCKADPKPMIEYVNTHNIFPKVLNVLNTVLTTINECDASTLELINHASMFLSFCLVASKNNIFKQDLERLPYLPKQIMNTFKLPGFKTIEFAIFWLILGIEQNNVGNQFVSEFQKGNLWQQLGNALENPISEKHSLLLIKTLAYKCSKALQDKSDPPKEGDYGVCDKIIQNIKQTVKREQAMETISEVLIAFPTIKSLAWKLKLFDTVLCIFDNCCSSITTTSLSQTWFREVFLCMELLFALLYSDKNIIEIAKKTSILVSNMNQLWDICVKNDELFEEIIKLLSIYTKSSIKGCNSLLTQYTAAIVKKTVKQQLTTGKSLLYKITDLIVANILTKKCWFINPLINILKQCCQSQECCTALRKTFFKQIFGEENEVNRFEMNTQKSLTLLVEKFTRHQTGQQCIIMITTAIEYFCFVSLSSDYDNAIRVKAVQTIRNICFCHENRAYIRNSEVIRQTFINHIQNNSSSDINIIKEILVSLWYICANDHRTKQIMLQNGVYKALKNIESTGKYLESTLKFTLSVFESKE